MIKKQQLLAVVFALSLLAGFEARAQWQTQSILVKPGWTGVYLHVDASGQSLDQLVGGDAANPITEIWLWKAAASSAQYLTSPQAPLNSGGQWVTWSKASGGKVGASLGSLAPNTAYLIHSTASANYTWNVKGKPVPPSYSWDLSGLNFIGFSTPTANPPNFQNYLAPAQSLAGITELYQYTGGNLGANNPGPVFSQYGTRVTRGQAFWIRATNVNNTYFGPFQIGLPNTGGLEFGDASGQFSLHLRNATVNSLTVTARMLASEAAPAGQTPIAGQAPLLVRGALNVTNLTYGFSALGTGASQSWTLAPMGQAGSDVVVIVGINRYALTNNPGALYAGILQFTDSLGFSEVNIPVSAQSASTAGLWVGSASISQVANYLKTYQTNGGSLAISNSGAYVVTGINTNLGAVPTPFPLRLIIHNDGVSSVLLQRVYYGLRQDTNLVVATTESVLDVSHLNSARRITATQFPWSADNTAWPLRGQLTLGGALSTTTPIVVNYADQSVNPFLHTYHPDHDNLDATFQSELSQGSESYQITRQIALTMAAPNSDFTSLTSANRVLSGNYQETINLGGLAGATRSFNVSGAFSLNRISPIAILTTR